MTKREIKGHQSEFVYILRATRPEMLSQGPTQDELQAIDAHSDYLQKLADEGRVFFYGRTQNTDASSFGIVGLRVDSETAAREIMGQDPGVKQGIMRAELYPFRVAYMEAT